MYTKQANKHVLWIQFSWISWIVSNPEINNSTNIYHSIYMYVLTTARDPWISIFYTQTTKNGIHEIKWLHSHLRNRFFIQILLSTS